ncbi:MAG: glycerate kinase [Myxococcales bacterium]|nr:MAG: glycerate kinase [Myxococcales bacterium]
MLCVFDKFKDSMSPEQVASVARQSIEATCQNWHVLSVFLADGGENFAKIMTDLSSGAIQKLTVQGPRDSEVEAAFGVAEIANLALPLRELLAFKANGTVAFLEMAQSSGLQSLAMEQRDPWLTSSVGTGQSLIEASKHGVSSMVMGLGGSATQDLALGALMALGLECYDADGKVVSDASPAHWSRIACLDKSKLLALPPLWLACDVKNPLLGPQGTVYQYALQKGLAKEDLAELEKQTARMARLLLDCFKKEESWMEREGMGAAGGMAFGLGVAYDAHIASGAQLIEHALDLKRRIQDVDLVITGEGRFDRTSLYGKGPVSVLELASELGKPALLIAGRVEHEAKEQLRQRYPALEVLELSPATMPLEQALREAPSLLAKALEQWLKQS